MRLHECIYNKVFNTLGMQKLAIPVLLSNIMLPYMVLFNKERIFFLFIMSEDLHKNSAYNRNANIYIEIIIF